MGTRILCLFVDVLRALCAWKGCLGLAFRLSVFYVLL